MKLQDTQYAEDELALMRGEDIAEVADEPAQAAAGDDTDDTEADTGNTDTESNTPANTEPVADTPKAEAPFQFDGTLPEDYDAKKQALRAEKKDLRTQWSNGDLSDEEFAAKESEWDDKYEALQSDYLTAQALAKANAQIVARESQKTLQAIADAAAKQGIDYSDNALAMVYDQKLAQVKAEDGFKGKSFAEQAAEAHARVAKLFGKATTTPSDIKADGAKASDRTKIPTTLGSLPAAAAANLTDDATIDDLGDDPDLAEAKWSQMPTSKRSAVLRATLPNNRR